MDKKESKNDREQGQKAIGDIQWHLSQAHQQDQPGAPDTVGDLATQG